MQYHNLTFEGYGGKTATVTIPAADATADAEFDATVAAISSGALVRRTVTAGVAEFGNATPTDENHRINTGVRIYWRDTVTGRTGYFTVPVPNYTALATVGDEVTLADAGAMAALVTDLEANARSPIDGNVIEVTRAIIVSRK